MMIALIAAVAANGVIGRDNDLPWRLPDDLRHFRRLTLGHTVIMGRRTFASLPAPLTGRHVVVVSRGTFAPERAMDVDYAVSIEDALARARSHEVFIAGGASLYAQTLTHAQRLYLTQVDTAVNGDAYFPPYEPGEWREVTRESHARDPRHAYPFVFLTLERRRP